MTNELHNLAKNIPKQSVEDATRFLLSASGEMRQERESLSYGLSTKRSWT